MSTTLFPPPPPGGSTAEVDIKLSTAAAEAAPAVIAQERWQRAYARQLFLGDAAVVIAANLAAVFIRFGGHSESLKGTLSYPIAALIIAAVWIAALASSRAYEMRFLGGGSEEYKRVANASVRLAATVALVAVAFKLPLARGFLLVSLGAGAGLLLVFRYVARRILYRGRKAGRWLHRVLVVGSASTAHELISEVGREPLAGFSVVAAAVDDQAGVIEVGENTVPIVGGIDDLVASATLVAADTIAIAGSKAITPAVLRRLAWQLEGTGIDLIVAPALTNVAGPRISIRPVAGLPLLHVEEPEITGVRYLIKEVFERGLAVLLGVLLTPFMLAIAAIVRLSSRGPVFFRQTRVSRHGDEFEVLKFRSMYVDAEARLDALRQANDNADGPLFKVRADPRTTPIGRLLRRYSLDELPQLWNVIRGDMSLVGPRPPLPSEVANYDLDAKRRLLVKPGMTGLWQVSGRSDLSWEDTVRLDLYYVENWSFTLDVQILVRTVRAVLAGRGAY